MKPIKNIIILLCITIVYSCSSGGSDGPETPTPTPTPKPPTAASLEFPLNNSECTEGTNITSTESTIQFNWRNSENTDSYQLVLKNLDTQTTNNYNSNVSELGITLQRGTPFSWYVISKSNSISQTAQSTTWKFYNAGDAVSSYAPFPAELIYPVMGSAFNSITSNVALQWSGSDVDDDITEYEIFFGIANPPTTSQGTTPAPNMDMSVNSGDTYYWRVVTKDSQNNSSNSEIFQFKIN